MMLATVRAVLALAVGTSVASAPMSSPAVRMAAPRPVAKSIPYQLGKAAWYGEKFHGRQTASGEPFDMNQLTAAHRDLPLGRLIRVTNLRNHKAVVVRINDRGPWGQPRRVIDLSFAASRELGMVHAGIAPVRLELLPKGL